MVYDACVCYVKKPFANHCMQTDVYKHLKNVYQRHKHLCLLRVVYLCLFMYRCIVDSACRALC